METYEKPLNLAHQQGRKAERFLEAGQYQDAIDCHKKAADYLNEALLDAGSPQSQESISLQRQHHLKQQEIILMKHQQHKHRLEQTDRLSVDGDTDVTEESNRTEENHDTLTIDTNSNANHAEDCSGQNKDAYQTMNECDSLLKILKSRDYFKAQHQPNGINDMVQSAIKVAKDDKQVIEELRVRNEILTKHVELLLREIEELASTNREKDSRIDTLEQHKRQLVKRLEKMAHSCADSDIDSFPVHINPDSLSSFKLPPLEVPQFDFEDALDDED